MVISIVLLGIGLGLIIWAIALRRRARARSFVGIGAVLLAPLAAGLGGVIMIASAVYFSPLNPYSPMAKRTVSFTITCATGCAPTYVRVDEVEIRGQDLLDTEDPTTPNVYKGDLEVNIVDTALSLTVMAVGPSGRTNKCNFVYKGKPLYSADRKLTEEASGKYRFYEIKEIQ